MLDTDLNRNGTDWIFFLCKLHHKDETDLALIGSTGVICAEQRQEKEPSNIKQAQPKNKCKNPHKYQA